VLTSSSQEALPILKDQRELLKTLVEEKVASQKQYDQVLKRLDQLTVGKDDTSLSSLTREITSTTNSSVTLVDQGRSTETLPGTSQDDLLPTFPAHLQHRAAELIEHCRLVKTVIGEVNHAQYKIDLGIRYRTQELVLGSHYSEWAHLLGSHVNDAYQIKAQDRFNFLETCPELVSTTFKSVSRKSNGTRNDTGYKDILVPPNLKSKLSPPRGHISSRGFILWT
jgi:hypothetical protein